MQQVLPYSNAMISLLVIPLSYLLITVSLNSGWRARLERGQSPEKNIADRLRWYVSLWL